MRLLDECDSVSFNATFGPNFCVKSGSVTAAQFTAALNNAPTAIKPDGTPVGFGDIGTSGVAPGTGALDIVPAKGVHQYQCIFHPWMRTVVTVR